MAITPFSIPEADESWFDQSAKSNFIQFLVRLPYPFTALQIGVFRGDATLWLITNFPDIQLTDVDPWDGVVHIPNPVGGFDIDYSIAERVYDERVGKRGNVTKLKMTSNQVFETYSFDAGRIFDFIYIDGDHHANQALTDLNNAHLHLKPKGILAFDDYIDGCYDLSPDQQPKLAADTFYKAHEKEYKVLLRKGQFWMQKR